jgi:ATP-dependent protease HslVU (ClpYQ) peptidase subunit
MTTLAAYRAPNGEIALAADAAVTGEFINSVRGGKIFRAGDLWIAVAGIIPPKTVFASQPATETGVRALAQEFTDAMEDANHGTAIPEEGIFAYPGSAIIVGRGCGPWILTATGQVIEYDEPFAVAGSGGAIALGAMAALTHVFDEADDSDDDDVDNTSLRAGDVVMIAVEVATQYDPSTRGPISMVLLAPPGMNTSSTEVGEA